jgi:hypothetical protein
MHLQLSPKYKKVGVPNPLSPIYIGERKTTFAKAYGIKKKGVYIMNMLGKKWEPKENTLGTMDFFNTPPHPLIIVALWNVGNGVQQLKVEFQHLIPRRTLLIKIRKYVSKNIGCNILVV